MRLSRTTRLVSLAPLAAALLFFLDLPKLELDQVPITVPDDFFQPDRPVRVYADLKGTPLLSKPFQYKVMQWRSAWLIPIWYQETNHQLIHLAPAPDQKTSTIVFIRLPGDADLKNWTVPAGQGLLRRPERELQKLLREQGVPEDAHVLILDHGELPVAPNQCHLLIGLLVLTAVGVLYLDLQSGRPRKDWTIHQKIPHWAGATKSFTILAMLILTFGTLILRERSISKSEFDASSWCSTVLVAALLSISTVLSHHGVALCREGIQTSRGWLSHWDTTPWSEITHLYRSFEAAGGENRLLYRLATTSGAQHRFQLDPQQATCVDRAILESLKDLLFHRWGKMIANGEIIDLGGLRVSRSEVSGRTMRGFESIPIGRLASWTISDRAIKFGSGNADGLPPVLLTIPWGEVSFPHLTQEFVQSFLKEYAPDARASMD